MYVVLAVFCFGVMIFVHEGGHFCAAKSLGVKVTEFSMGMGPRLFHFTRGETDYSLRLLPLGGFCAMEGEEDDSDDPRAFSKAAAWKRLIIFIAGSFMNFLLGFVITAILYSNATGFTGSVICGFYENCPYEGDLQVGDEFYSVNGQRTWFSGNFSEYVGRTKEAGYVDLVIRRDGKKIELPHYHMVPVEYPTGDGGMELKYGLYFDIAENTPGNFLRYTWYSCLDTARLVWVSLGDLIAGAVPADDLTGVVGMVDYMAEAGEAASSVRAGVEEVLYIVSFISINLAVMNMLPVPGLDGGHVATMLITELYILIFRHAPNPKIERVLHAAGLVALLGFSFWIMFKDIIRIVIS